MSNHKPLLCTPCVHTIIIAHFVVSYNHKTNLQSQKSTICLSRLHILYTDFDSPTNQMAT